MPLHQPNLHSCGVQTPEAININKSSEFLGGVVGLDGLGLDDDGGVIALDVAALVGNHPRHVATRHRDARHNDCHNQ